MYLLPALDPYKASLGISGGPRIVFPAEKKKTPPRQLFYVLLTVPDPKKEGPLARQCTGGISVYLLPTSNSYRASLGISGGPRIAFLEAEQKISMEVFL